MAEVRLTATTVPYAALSGKRPNENGQLRGSSFLTADGDADDEAPADTTGAGNNVAKSGGGGNGGGGGVNGRTSASLVTLVKWALQVAALPLIVGLLSLCDPSLWAIGDLTWKAYATLSLTSFAFLAMMGGGAPELVMIVVNLALLLLKVISVDEVIAGLGSSSVLSLANLFAVAKGIEQAGTMAVLLTAALGSPSTVPGAIVRLALPVALISAFMNNTPVVAMMIPVVEAWAQKTGHPVSVLLLPLAFASQFGGMCTLIGTSTNLVLKDIAETPPEGDDDYGGRATTFQIDMFTMTPVGAGIALVGIATMAICHRLLPRNGGGGGGGGSKVVLTFSVDFLVLPSGKGLTPATLGALNVPGARLESVTRPLATANLPSFALTSELSKGARDGTASGDGGRFAIGLGLGPPSTASTASERAAAAAGEALDGGEVLRFRCCADALASLRSLRELSLVCQPSIDLALGPGRRHRRLFECVLDEGSPLLGLSVAGHEAQAASVFHHQAFVVAHKPTKGGKGPMLFAQSFSSRDQQKNTALEPALGSLFSRLAYVPPKLPDRNSPEALARFRLEASAMTTGLSFGGGRGGVLDKTVGDSEAGSGGSGGGGGMLVGPDRLVIARSNRQPRTADTATAQSSPVDTSTSGSGSLYNTAVGTTNIDDSDLDQSGDLLGKSFSGFAKAFAAQEASSNAAGKAARGEGQGASEGKGRLVVYGVGDTVVVEARETFASLHGGAGCFALARELRGSAAPRNLSAKDTMRVYAAGAVLVAMVSLVAAGLGPPFDIFTLSLAAACALVWLQCMTVGDAFGAINGRVLLSIFATYGLSSALQNTGVAEVMAQALISAGKATGPVGLLSMIFLATALLSGVVSNQATVILLWPVVRRIDIAGLHVGQFAIVLMMGASSGFTTPIGSSVNLMVYGPGSYVFNDYLTLGGLLVAVLTPAAGILVYYLV